MVASWKGLKDYDMRGTQYDPGPTKMVASWKELIKEIDGGKKESNPGPT